MSIKKSIGKNSSKKVINILAKLRRRHNENDNINIWNESGMKYYYLGEFNDAINYLTRSANYNNSDAQIMLSIVNIRIRDFPQAYKYIKLSVDNNNSTAQYIISISIINLFIQKEISSNNKFNKELNIKLDLETAIKYLKLSLIQGNIHALYELGKLYIYGLHYNNIIYIAVNINRAIKCFEICSTRNHKYSLIILAFLYKNGLFVDKNIEKSKEYYELSNTLNSPSRLDFMNKYIK